MSLVLMHVDDEPDIREVAAFALELDPGIDLASVGSGEEALARLRSGFRPDAILLDVMMPRLDGPGVLEQLRKIPGLETTPVIFMTARVQSGEIEWLEALGSVGVIVKPFDPMTLADDVRGLLASEQA